MVYCMVDAMVDNFAKDTFPIDKFPEKSRHRIGFRNITMFNPEMTSELIEAVGTAISKLQEDKLDDYTYDDIIKKAYDEIKRIYHD